MVMSISIYSKPPKAWVNDHLSLIGIFILMNSLFILFFLYLFIAVWHNWMLSHWNFSSHLIYYSDGQTIKYRGTWFQSNTISWLAFIYISIANFSCKYFVLNIECPIFTIDVWYWWKMCIGQWIKWTRTSSWKPKQIKHFE